MLGSFVFVCMCICFGELSVIGDMVSVASVCDVFCGMGEMGMCIELVYVCA